MIPKLKDYEHSIQIIARLYYGLYTNGRGTDVDVSDLEQAGRIAIFQISQRKPELLNSKAYVSAAIKFSMIREMKKMRHKVPQVYLVHQHEENVPIVDVLPTRETAPEKLEHMDDLLYQVRHEFSPREADALDALVQKCGDVYDLNLSAPPSTETKDRVKIVTAMDLDDDEMIIYAQVLMGARTRFPDNYIQSERGRERAKKFLKAVIQARGLSIEDFAGSKIKKKILQKYRLWSYVTHAYNSQIPDFLQDLDHSLSLTEMAHVRKWRGQTSRKYLSELVHQLAKRLRKNPTELTSQDFRENDLGGLVTRVFGNHRLTVEFAYPGTYPKYKERAKEIWDRYK